MLKNISAAFKEPMNLCFVGGGQMAASIITGLVNNKKSFYQIKVIRPSNSLQSNYSFLSKALEAKGSKTLDLIANYKFLENKIDNCQALFLTVKPQQIENAIASLMPCFKNGTLPEKCMVISVAAGTTVKSIQNYLIKHSKNNLSSSLHSPFLKNIARCMPNLPASIGLGATGFYVDGSVTSADRSMVTELLESTGLAVQVDKETLLNAVTGVSGSGPAFFYLLLEHLIHNHSLILSEPDRSVGPREALANLLEIYAKNCQALLDLPETTLTKRIDTNNNFDEFSNFPDKVAKKLSIDGKVALQKIHHFVEQIITVGEEKGLPRLEARILTLQTALGAAAMVKHNTHKSLKDLRKEVTSPNGTTFAGLAKLQLEDPVGTIKDAVKAAIDRAEEIAAM